MYVIFGAECEHDNGLWDETELTPQELRWLRRQGAKVVRVAGSEDEARLHQPANRQSSQPDDSTTSAVIG
jgi:hypothetical protein